MIYVMSDIHGCYDEFIKMLEQINFSDEDTLYIIGDIIDRGYDIVKLIRYVMKHDNIILLKGNHEDMCVESFKYVPVNSQYFLWQRNGGTYTLNEFVRLEKEEVDSFLDYFNDLPTNKFLVVNDRKFFLVHGGYWGKDENKQLWYRMIGTEKALDDVTVIFGHTNSNHYQHKIPLEAWVREDNAYICIDCGLAKKSKSESRLCCLRLDDMKFFYEPFTKNFF